MNERNIFLTKKMGICIHKTDPTIFHMAKCIYCGENVSAYSGAHQPIDFSTWEGFGKLLTWVRKSDFMPDIVEIIDSRRGIFWWTEPDKFADIVYSYLKSIEK